MSLSRKSFYGSTYAGKHARIENKIEKVVSDFQAHPVCVATSPQLLGPRGEWKVWHRQKDAFAYAATNVLDFRVFSFESEAFTDNCGKRLFLVTSYDMFWKQYSKLAPSLRNHYEVIPEGAACWLYFDLEFYKEVNGSRDGDSMVDIFTRYICTQLKHRFGVDCQMSDVLQLDASTDAKFSRHLIFRPPFTVFKDNVHAGRFVRACISELLHFLNSVAINSHKQISTCVNNKPTKEILMHDTCDNIHNDEHCESQEQSKEKKTHSQITTENTDKCNPEVEYIQQDLQKTNSVFRGFDIQALNSLLVKNKDGQTVPFCDMGVYTKNRNFRLYLSSKLRKNNPLVVPSNSQYKVVISQNKSHSTEKQTFLDSLVCNVDMVKNSPHLNLLTVDDNMENFCAHFAAHQINSIKPADDENVLEGYHFSPYPHIDDFVQSLLYKDGKQGSIRRWVYFPGGELITYDIVHYRWCENVGRHHKSNNIMFIVDLKAGCYYQKCHDPECKQQNFKSPERKLPEELLPSFCLAEEEQCSFYEGEMSDDELLIAVNEAEFRYKNEMNMITDE